MTEQTLLLVFIGLVALSLVGIAVSIGVVAWRAAALLKELDTIAEDVHTAGRMAAADLQKARTHLKNGLKMQAFIAAFRALLRRSGSARRAKKASR